MMQQIKDPRMLAAAIVAGLAMLTLALAFTWRAHDQEKLRHLAKTNCTQIEALKTELRLEAVRDYNQFTRNAELLGIEITPELLQIAMEERNKTLARFSPMACSGH